MTNSKTKISGKQYTIYFDRDVDDIIDDRIDSDVKYNHVDLDIDTKTGKLQISAFFECKRLETAYSRFAKIFDRIAAEVALLTGWNFIPAKKLTQNPYGWENENGDQIFHADGNESLSVDINEDTYYIFGNMSKAVEVAEEIAVINAADVKVNVADNGKVIEQIKVDVDTAIKIINRLNYRNDTFVYSNTTRYDNADIQCRHFNAYRDNGESDGFAITEIVINGKLEIVRFANLFRDIIVHLQIGNVNYTIGDKGAIVLTDGDNPDNEPDDKQAKKEMARKLTAYLNGCYEQRLQAGYKPITPYATCDVRYQKLRPVARWTVGYDSVNDTFGIWSEYGWHESGFSLGYEFCGWYKIAKLAVIIARLKDAIDYAQTEFYFEDTDTLSKRPRRGCGKRTRLCYGKWRQIQAANLKDKIDRDAQGTDEDNVFSLLPALDELNDVDIDDDAPEAFNAATEAEEYNARVASGNYSVDINGEYVRFENHSIVRIDAMRKMNWIYDHTGANKIFRYGNRKSSAAKVIDMYMNGERADEQGKYFHEFFDQYCKTCGDIVVLVELTYADGREHHFRAEFNQGRLADKFIADVKELAGDTPCQTFIKYRNNYVKPVWEDPHKYETVGNLEHARHLYGEETVGDIAPEEYIITQEAFDEAVEAEEFEALFAKWTAEILSDPRIEAVYRKARERVEVEFTADGIPLYTYIKKNGERCYNDFVAKCYIGKCGLRETDFIVKARAEAKITRDRRTENNDLTEAEELTAKLREVTRKADYMTVITQSGEHIISRFGNVAVIIDDSGFIFTNGHETLAGYATKEQCLEVIRQIKTAVDFGDNEFAFLKAADVELELKLPALIMKQFNKYRYRSKGRSVPRRFLAAQLKYYGLNFAELKEAQHAN